MSRSRTSTVTWHQANQRYLMAHVARIRLALETHIARVEGKKIDKAARALVDERIESARAELREPAALDLVRSAFELSSFEIDLLLLAAAMEYDGSFPSLCAAAQGDPQRAYPTFSLAIAALDDPEWSALAPTGSLRHWRLIEPGAGPALTLSPLRIDEWMVHYLAGVPHLDERLGGLVTSAPAPGELVPSHARIAEQLAGTWSRTFGVAEVPVIQLCGGEFADRRAIASGACAMLGLRLGIIPAVGIPVQPGELDSLMRLWEREAILNGCALLLECDGIDAAGDQARAGAINWMVERGNGLLIISGDERRRQRQRSLLSFDVRKPEPAEQRGIWVDTLGELAPELNGSVTTLVSQFNLSAPAIRTAWSGALGRLAASSGEDGPTPGEVGAALWETCRAQARPKLDDLAQHIEPHAGWDDLILPDAQRRVLRDLASHLRHRAKVYDDWGFAGRGRRGLGITALFAGGSGTGKTMASEVIARELSLDLYRIDLSAVVSKYIGETEKNLRSIFDAAEEGGVILLFDEADALFGKRSEVKDSHDRHANIEVSYLLQRMEAYRGLAILTTNLKDALDTAFLRRIRFIVQFPFPDVAQRTDIWRTIFPGGTPTEGLDPHKLARLNISGGNIRNIALNAAFLAADAGDPVTMAHLLQAVRSEYEKLERPLTEAEIRGWV